MDFQHLVLHIAVFGIYLYAAQYYVTSLKMPRRPGHEFAGHLKYLTYWNLLIHCSFFGLSVLNDLLSRSKRFLSNFLDGLFTSVVLPAGLFVATVFWVLYAIDRELILPKVLDPFYPSWLNHVSHTLIVPSALIEAHVCYHPHASRKGGIIKLLTFTLIYLVWLLFLGIHKNIWVYPVLEVLNWGMRVLFFLACAMVMSMLYIIGEHINHILWRSRLQTQAKRSL